MLMSMKLWWDRVNQSCLKIWGPGLVCTINTNSSSVLCVLIITIKVPIIAIIANNWNNRAQIDTVAALMQWTNVSLLLALSLSIVVSWSASATRKLRPAAALKCTIIAIIGKLSLIIAWVLAFHVLSELDLHIPVGLGAQLVRLDSLQSNLRARGEHMLTPACMRWTAIPSNNSK